MCNLYNSFEKQGESFQKGTSQVFSFHLFLCMMLEKWKIDSVAYWNVQTYVEMYVRQK